MTALEVLQEVTKVGGRLLPNGEKIAMEAPQPLPQELIERIRQNKPALLAILNPRPPRHAGGFPISLKESLCALCGGAEWQQHITYRYCLTCGVEAGPGAVEEEMGDR